nr:uncharacterized protein LOC115268136 [Aedes albopictus]
MELNDQDFIRLRLKTKTIKLIQRLQSEFENAPVVEEFIDNDSEEEKPEVASFSALPSDKQSGNDDIDQGEDSDDDEPIDNTTPNPYKSIVLEKKINVDRIFKRTDDGLRVIELLKQGTKPNDKLLNEIKKILCHYLRLNYGARPSAFHKNMLAISLVESYPVLRSSTRDVPQALWFYPHARGKHRHSGRLQYHLEYLVRKSSDRKILRTKKADLAPEEPSPHDESLQHNENIEEMIAELKFLCPGPNTRIRAEELWQQTFEDRARFRKNGSFHVG